MAAAWHDLFVETRAKHPTPHHAHNHILCWSMFTLWFVLMCVIT